MTHDEAVRLVDELEALPPYRGWLFSYEYPGYFCYSHDDLPYRIAFTPDWEGDEILPIEVTDNDGGCYEEHCTVLPLPRSGRTGALIAQMLRPTLDLLIMAASVDQRSDVSQ